MPRDLIEFQVSDNFDNAVARAAQENRIDQGYWDIFRKWRTVTPDIQKRILAALGWDVSSMEAIDRERQQRFRQEYTSIVPATTVVAEVDKTVPVTFWAIESGSFCFDIALESGKQLSGTLHVGQLHGTHDVVVGNEHWTAYSFPLPSELPLGYHKLRITRDRRVLGEGHLIVCPERAYLPDNLVNNGRSAGFNVTLYGLRSGRNWGCGDFTDLRPLIDWAHDQIGFSFIGLNPLHALHNRVPYNTSPYLPLSIYYKNPIYIDIESLPEFNSSSCAKAIFANPRMQDKLRLLREAEFVAYQDVHQLKRKFLKVLYREFRRDRARNPERSQAFSDYCEREGDLLDNFALYCALDESLHWQDRNRWTWLDWPREYQNPQSEECRSFGRDHARSVEFHKYIQFVLDEQLSAAQAYAKQKGLPIGLYHDLALATDSCGSDLWAYRDYFVNGCRVGAPPDDFSPSGQDWAFPPPNAELHRSSGYRLYRESIRKIVEHGGALRIDHVMRLFRLFWIPDGASAAEGTYVRDYATELMRILALESVRSKNIIIGEDLGTVTDEIRGMLSQFGILSYRVFYFERNYHDKSFNAPSQYPRPALVASSTHDLATMCGFWTFRDIEARRHAGLADEHGYQSQVNDRKREKQMMLDRLHAENLLPSSYPRNAEKIPQVDGELHNAVVGFLSRVPSMLLLLNQEDFTKETEQQNLPGSTAEYPNWQRKMKATLEDLPSAFWRPYCDMFRAQLERNGRRAG